MSLNILPYIFTRFAAFPLQSLNTLIIPEIEDQLKNWHTATAYYKDCNEKLCNKLYTMIQQCADSGEQKLLLNLKRSVYNGRQNAGALIQKIEPETFESFKDYWEKWLDAGVQCQEFERLWEKDFHDYLSSHRQEIRQLIGKYPFRNGVLLSSKDLYQQLDSFESIASKLPNKDNERIEFSVLRYLTRMTYKTSPFSTFTYLGLTKMVSGDGIDLSPGCETPDCKIRLNNKLLKRVKKLMERHPDLQGLLFVNTNSSVTGNDERFSFLMNCANIEVFQEIQSTGVNQYIRELINSLKESTSLSAFIELLSEHIEADFSELQHYVLKLIDAGFLELTLECSEIDPDWDIHLLKFLSQHKKNNPSAGQLYELISDLQQAKNEFGTAEISQREAILKKMAKHFDDTISDLENQAGIIKIPKDETLQLLDDILKRYKNGDGFEKLPYVPVDYRQEGFIYEDAFTSQITEVNESTIHRFGHLLSDLTNCLTAFDIRGKEKDSIKNFFISRYSKNQYVSLVTFYHEYYRHKNEFATEDHQDQTNSVDAWSDHFWKDLQHNQENEQSDEVRIYRENLTPLPASNHSCPSGSAFLQFFDQQSETGTKAVVNGLMQGMGKMSGRFLHLFNPEIAEVHRNYNKQLFPDKLLIELNDDSSFNANIHPPLLDYEVKMPSSNTQMKKSQQIPLDRISVGYHENNDTLCLMDNVLNKEIYAFDLCLESITNRSNLYQMMSLFNPCIYISYYPLIQSVDQHFPKQSENIGIQILPRIVFEDQLVLRRKGWLLNMNTIPEQKSNESDGVYFLHFHEWLLKNNLPSSLFLYLQSPYIPKDDLLDKAIGTRDDYKPQYIDFDQPLLFGLFRKLLNRAGSYIYLEEALPAVDDSQERVAEHLVQWYDF